MLLDSMPKWRIWNCRNYASFIKFLGCSNLCLIFRFWWITPSSGMWLGSMSETTRTSIGHQSCPPRLERRSHAFWGQIVLVSKKLYRGQVFYIITLGHLSSVVAIVAMWVYWLWKQLCCVKELLREKDFVLLYCNGEVKHFEVRFLSIFTTRPWPRQGKVFWL